MVLREDELVKALNLENKLHHWQKLPSLTPFEIEAEIKRGCPRAGPFEERE